MTSETQAAITKLRELLADPPNAIKIRLGKGLSDAELEAIEQQIGLKIPGDYRAFLCEFGFLSMEQRDDHGLVSHLTIFGSPVEVFGRTKDLASAVTRYKQYIESERAKLTPARRKSELKKWSGAIPFLPFQEYDGEEENNDWNYAHVLTEDGRVASYDEDEGKFEIEDKDTTFWSSMTSAVSSFRTGARMDAIDLDRVEATHARWLEADPDATHAFGLYGLGDGAILVIYSGSNNNPGQATFAGKDIRHLDLSGKDFRAAIFGQAKADGVSFANAKLEDACIVRLGGEKARFDGANLARADFSDANLRGASFKNADCTCTDFERADLTGADFTGAKLEGIKTTRTINPPSVSSEVGTQ